MMLTSRKPQPTPQDLITDLVPPPLFNDVSLDTYVPDPDYPSQQEAVDRVRAFAEQLGAGKKQGIFSGLFGPSKPTSSPGLYLDGGFGVGKTHLLTSLFHMSPGRAAYGTFVEYTNLVGVLGFKQAVDEFSGLTLMCIDEFELDDVGDTLLMTRLIRELTDRGVAIAATSNTLPRALGEGRFAAQDFLREINAMADRFEVIRIDGEDYRHRDDTTRVPQIEEAEVRESATETDSLDTFEDALAHLAKVHPSRYGALVEGLTGVHLTGVRTVTDHLEALRLVVFVDRLYDRAIPVAYSGVPAERIFADDLLTSGYSKKYYRCLSRFGALANRRYR